MRPIVLIVGHGSRDAPANQEFEHLVARYQARRPEIELRFGYVELARPSLAEALADLPVGCEEVVILPLFLFAAGHVKNDIPLALAAARKERPHVRFRSARALGVHPEMAELVLARGEEAFPLGDADARPTAVVMVGRGSSDPDANGDFCKLTRLVGEARPFAWVVPAFVGITRPRFEEALEFVARARPERLLVVPYLLFAGRLFNQLQDAVADFRGRYPWIKTALAPQLGVHERLLKVLDERLDEARNGEAPLPTRCTTSSTRCSPPQSSRQTPRRLQPMSNTMGETHAFTIGFTKKSAESFFTKLRDAGVMRVLDVRLNNSSQLAGFAKRDDLRFFLKGLYGLEYVYLPELTPTKEILDAYKKHKGDWSVYEREFLELMARRRIQDVISREILDRGCLLCSEHLPKHCHRRLVIEYLQRHWKALEVTHIT